jgi:hypothetical protein
MSYLTLRFQKSVQGLAGPSLLAVLAVHWVVLEGLEAAASRAIPAVSPKVADLVDLRPVMAVVDHLLGMEVERQVAVALLQDMGEAHQGAAGHRPVTEVAELQVGSD